MAAISSSPSRRNAMSKLGELKQRLQHCWDLKLNWDLYAEPITEVCLNN